MAEESAGTKCWGVAGLLGGRGRGVADGGVDGGGWRGLVRGSLAGRESFGQRVRAWTSSLQGGERAPGRGPHISRMRRPPLQLVHSHSMVLRSQL